MKKVFLIVSTAILFRLIGINWDQGFHLHPDERMLLMVTDRIRFFGQLNPDFFNYGSLPIYLLRGIAQLYDSVTHNHIASYDGMLILGRMLSMVTDLATIFFIYKISRELFHNNTVSGWSCVFYAMAFFPIQNSHFFIADTFLTCFTTILFWRILLYLRNPGFNTIFYIAIAFSFALATKFTAILFLPFLIVLFLFHLNKKGQLVVNSLKQSIVQIPIFCILSSIFFFLSMPYAILEFGRFYKDITYQMRMNSNPYIFPYTLQYVNTLPYLYPLKQIILWGLGPIISIVSFIGIILIIKNILGFIFKENSNAPSSFRFAGLRRTSKTQNYHLLLVFFTFYIFYFIIIGRSAVKFMRYMLPIYPFFAIMAGYAMSRIQNIEYRIKNLDLRFKNSRYPLIAFLILIGTVSWTLFFMNIYSQKHTRIEATEWILKNIPKGKTLAVEHWDDRLPLAGSENYTMVELPLYDLPDDERKWEWMNERISSSDYIIIASNRLYTPLQKLSDCQKYKSCYPLTADYYKNLFGGSTGLPARFAARRAGQAGFVKVAEFSAYPGIKIGNTSLVIPDDTADESFTVYDHPHIFIFKKKTG